MELRRAGSTSRCSPANRTRTTQPGTQRQVAQVRHEGRAAGAGHQRRAQFLHVHRGAGRGPRRGLHPRRHATEFNHFAPNFGEKYSPPHLPVSIQDWTGREISRVYSDQFGSYNFLVPSTLHDQPAVPVGRDAQHDGGVHEPPGADHAATRSTGADLRPASRSTRSSTAATRSSATRCSTCPARRPTSTRRCCRSRPSRRSTKNPLDCECEDGTPAIYSATNGTTTARGCPRRGGTLTIVSVGTVRGGQPGVRSGGDSATA